jgi:hypothetical protein
MKIIVNAIHSLEIINIDNLTFAGRLIEYVTNRPAQAGLRIIARRAKP